MTRQELRLASTVTLLSVISIVGWWTGKGSSEVAVDLVNLAPVAASIAGILAVVLSSRDRWVLVLLTLVALYHSVLFFLGIRDEWLFIPSLALLALIGSVYVIVVGVRSGQWVALSTLVLLGSGASVYSLAAERLGTTGKLFMIWIGCLLAGLSAWIIFQEKSLREQAALIDERNKN